jgi:hypothetical protein
MIAWPVFILKVIATIIIANVLGVNNAVSFTLIISAIFLIIVFVLWAFVMNEFSVLITVPLYIILMVNLVGSFSLNPSVDDIYAPAVGFRVETMEGWENTNLRNIDANESFIFQVGLTVQSNSWARNMFGQNDIDITIEIDNPSVSIFSEARNVRLLRENRPSEIFPDRVVFHYTLMASRNPRTSSLIEFQVTPVHVGSQTIRISFDEKVNDIHTRTVMLEYR